MDASVRSLFSPTPGVAYLDSATYGLPPEPTVRAMEEALAAWRAGSADWITEWDRPAERARSAFARLMGVDSERVALLPAVSVGVGVVAAGLGPDDDVVVPADEFTSVLFPLLVAGEHGATIRQVEFGRVPDETRPETTLVAISLVQMQTGRVAPLEEIVDRAEAVGARVLLDVTQGSPFVSLDTVIDRIDYVVTAAYKHLLCPRGVAFMVVRGDRLPELAPWNANWRSADDPYTRYFGGPLTLPRSAARLDVSLAWLPWVGAVESLELLAGWADQGLLHDPPRLASNLAEAIGVPWGGATLVCVPVSDGERARAGLVSAGVRAAVRGTSIRLSPHVYNDSADVERAAEAIGPFVEVPPGG